MYDDIYRRIKSLYPIPLIFHNKICWTAGALHRHCIGLLYIINTRCSSHSQVVDHCPLLP